MIHPRAIFIAGPTAVGKSALALLLAEKLGGEIISVDSMQVYRGLDIGTAKPSADERARVRHHLIDVMDLAEPFDAARFSDLSKAAVSEIEGRGKIPIFCGGTGLYFKAFLEGLGEAPPADENLRRELEQAPASELLRELELKDPVTFARIDKQNPRRVIRAIEVIRLTGQAFSSQRADWNIVVPKQNDRSDSGHFIGIARQTEDLRYRIDARVDEMFQRGLVQETKALLEQGLAENRTAMQAIGYRQVVEHLGGERSLKETVELIKTKTRQFAKRQMTWFRGQMNLEWVDAGQPDYPNVVLDRLCREPSSC